MSSIGHDVAAGHEHVHGDHAHETPHGWRRWLYATNHKDIGTLYLLFSFIMFLSGGVMALGIRSELFEPGLQIMRPEFFNQLTTMHGLIMVFGAIMPAFVGFANWMIPLQIGASDMAFARMVAAVAGDEEFELYGDGTQSRSSSQQKHSPWRRQQTEQQAHESCV